MGYIVISKRLAGIPNVALLVRPMVHMLTDVNCQETAVNCQQTDVNCQQITVSLQQTAFICQQLKAGGRGASLSACAGPTNQLLSCWVDPRIAWIKHLHSNCRRPVDGSGGGDTTPCTVNWCKKIPSGVPD